MLFISWVQSNHRYLRLLWYDHRAPLSDIQALLKKKKTRFRSGDCAIRWRALHFFFPGCSLHKKWPRTCDWFCRSGLSTSGPLALTVGKWLSSLFSLYLIYVHEVMDRIDSLCNSPRVYYIYKSAISHMEPFHEFFFSLFYFLDIFTSHPCSSRQVACSHIPFAKIYSAVFRVCYQLLVS